MTDTERLIEEAGRLCDAATAGPWFCGDCTVANWNPGVTEQPDVLIEWIQNSDEPDTERTKSDALFIARARTLVPDLVTALRAERERAEKAEEQARQQSVWAENIAAVAEQTNAVARDCIRERDAARAELARLTTPRPIAEAPRESGKQIIALWMHGDVVESMDVVCWADMDMDGDHPERKFWMNTAGDSVEGMTHFLPLPAEGGQR